MKKLMLLLAFLGLSSWLFADQTKTDTSDRLNSAAQTLQQIMAAPDKGIPEEVLEGTKCVAVVPSLIKGGFVFGGKHGRGVATCKLSDGSWSAPAFFTVTGGSWGAQIGVEDVDLVMLIMNDDGMRQLLSNKFKIGGQASAAAGPVGRRASAGTDWKAGTEILTYSRAHGLFAGASLDGAWIEPDADSTKAFYGKDISTRELLTGKVPAPADAQSFLAAVKSAKMEAKKNS